MAKRDLSVHFDSLYMLGADIRTEEPLRWHTTIRVGGPAALFVSPYSPGSFIEIMRLAKREAIPYKLLGGGSNVVCPDRYEGMVLSTRNLNYLSEKDGSVFVQAGVSVNSLLWFCLSHGLAGLEFLTGLPGTVGGAVYMNAGAFGGEIGELVELIEYIDEIGDLRVIPRQSARFGYRDSVFKSRSCTIVGVRLKLTRGDKESIESKMLEILSKRLEKQPLNFPSAGSVFMRPRPDFFVGSTIEKLGFKGFCVGDAQISEKHAGFIINRGNATQREVSFLVEAIRNAVEKATGVELKSEIEIWREVE